MTDFTNIAQVNEILRFVKNCDAWPQLKINHQVNAWKEIHRLLDGPKTPASAPESIPTQKEPRR